MTEEQLQQVELLQSNLTSIRKIAGWTLDELGEKIGVTKQTIFNLETQKTKMTLTQYIAIRAVLDYEIHNNKNNEILGTVVVILLDKSKDLSAEKRLQLQEKASDISKMIASGVSYEEVKDSSIKLAQIAGIASTSASAAFAMAGAITGLGISPIIGGFGSVLGSAICGWMPTIQSKQVKKKQK